jgi:hypothetical protein
MEKSFVIPTDLMKYRVQNRLRESAKYVNIAVLKKLRYALPRRPMPYAHGDLCPMPTETYAQSYLI